VSIRLTCHGMSSATAVTTTTASRLAGSERCNRGRPAVSTTAVTSSPTTAHCGWAAKELTARTAPRTALSTSGAGTPRALGTCCAAITTAIPTVNPSINGHGT
jgi:hypothetical protein